MPENYTYGLGPSAIEKINRWALQQESAGRTINPSMLRAAIEAELNTAGNLARQESQFNRQSAVQQSQFAQSLDQNQRQFEENKAIQNKQIKAGQIAGYGQLAGSLASSYLTARGLGIFGPAKVLAPATKMSVAPGLAPSSLDAGMIQSSSMLSTTAPASAVEGGLSTTGLPPVETVFPETFSATTPTTFEVGQGAINGPATFGSEMGGSSLTATPSAVSEGTAALSTVPAATAALSTAGTPTGMSVAGAGAIETQMAAQGAYGAGAGAGGASAGALAAGFLPVAIVGGIGAYTSAQQEKSRQYNLQSYNDNFNYVKSIRPGWSDFDIGTFLQTRGGYPESGIADLSEGVPENPIDLIAEWKKSGNTEGMILDNLKNYLATRDPAYADFEAKYRTPIDNLEIPDNIKYGSEYMTYPEAYGGVPKGMETPEYDYGNLRSQIIADSYQGPAKDIYLRKLDSKIIKSIEGDGGQPSATGNDSSPTWLCTRTDELFPLSKREKAWLDKLKKYALRTKKYKAPYKEYVDIGGPRLIQAIKDSHKEMEFYREFKVNFLKPLFEKIDAGKMDDASSMYVNKLIILYIEYFS